MRKWVDFWKRDLLDHIVISAAFTDFDGGRVMDGVVPPANLKLGIYIIVVAMTTQAPAHGKIMLLLHSIHRLHRPVAGLALNARGDMPFVGKAHMLRQVVDFDPLETATCSIEFRQLLNMWTFLGHGFMAAHAE